TRLDTRPGVPGGGAFSQKGLAYGLCVQFGGAEKAEKTRKSSSERFGERFVRSQSSVLQPKTEDDQRAGRPVELAVKAGHEPVAPEDGQGIEIARAHVCTP